MSRHGKYLGETAITDMTGTPYEGFVPQDWALVYIGSYGQIDGDHHKLWVLDQVARILKGTPVNVRLAEWEDGFQEYRFTTGEPSEAYKAWVEEMKGDEEEYGYDTGSAP